MVKKQALLPEKRYEMTEHDGWYLTLEEEQKAVAEALQRKRDRAEWLHNRTTAAQRASWAATGEKPEALNIEEIVLSEEEIAEAMITANKHKYSRILYNRIRDEGRKMRQQHAEEVLREWDYARFYRLMKTRLKESEDIDLVFDARTEPIIKALCFRLSQDKRYETEMGLSLNKSLLIRGTSGLGKSMCVRMVASNPVRPIQLLTMHEITEAIKSEGDFKGFRFNDFWNIYLGDLGAEYDATPKVMHMGTSINFFRRWFEDMSDRNPDVCRRLIVSTNDDFDTLEAKYGFRVRDRMAQYFDVVHVEGESLRKT